VSDAEGTFRAVIAAVVEEDIDTAKGLLHEDVVFDWSRSRGPLQGIYRGPDEASSMWVQMQEAWEPLSWEIEVLPQPDTELIVFDSKPLARGRGSGIELQGHGGLIVRVHDGKVIEVTLYQTPEEALAAANDPTSQ
jgi:ketosteroid isomerase-like protein